MTLSHTRYTDEQVNDFREKAKQDSLLMSNLGLLERRPGGLLFFVSEGFTSIDEELEVFREEIRKVRISMENNPSHPLVGYNGVRGKDGKVSWPGL